MASEDFTLGEHVKFDAKLVRRKEYLPYEQAEEPEGPDIIFKRVARLKGEGRTWETVDEPMREGVLVGIRALKNGRVVYHGYGEGTEFRETESFRAALVAWSLTRVPTLVPLDRLYRDV